MKPLPLSFVRIEVSEMEKDLHKLELLRRIAELEKEGKWHLDVEDDPETYPLMPNDVDYLNEKLINKIKIQKIHILRLLLWFSNTVNKLLNLW